MNSTARRNAYRQARQANNYLSVTAEQKQAHPEAVLMFCTFGGKKGKSQGRPLDDFIMEKGSRKLSRLQMKRLGMRKNARIQLPPAQKSIAQRTLDKVRRGISRVSRRINRGKR